MSGIYPPDPEPPSEPLRGWQIGALALLSAAAWLVLVVPVIALVTAIG